MKVKQCHLAISSDIRHIIKVKKMIGKDYYNSTNIHENIEYQYIYIHTYMHSSCGKFGKQ